MQSIFKKTVAAAAVGAALSLGSGIAEASFTFVGGVGTSDFTIGDKLFSNFTCTAVPGLCEQVAYDPIPGGEFGVRFNPGGALNLAATGSRDVALGFEVSTTDGSFRISDFFISSNAALTTGGSVTDTLEICLDAACNQVILGPTLLSGNGLSFPDTLLPGGPYDHIWVFDDVATQVTAGSGGAAQISRLDKVVTQTTPEPATLLLLGGALAGMGWVRRRKS